MAEERQYQQQWGWSSSLSFIAIQNMLQNIFMGWKVEVGHTYFMMMIIMAMNDSCRAAEFSSKDFWRIMEIVKFPFAFCQTSNLRWLFACNAHCTCVLHLNVHDKSACLHSWQWFVIHTKTGKVKTSNCITSFHVSFNYFLVSWQMFDIFYVVTDTLFNEPIL